MSRTQHYSPRQGDAARVGKGTRHATAARCEHLWAAGGAAFVGWELHDSDPGAHIGMMVAANSGRPGGACGLRAQLDHAKLHPGHRTQEEDIVSSWIRTEAGDDPAAQDELYRGTIDQRWGMRDTLSTGRDTIQGVDYCRTTSPASFADTWLVPRAVMSAKSADDDGTMRFDTERQFPCTLVFTAGPNAGASASPWGSMARTRNAYLLKGSCGAQMSEEEDEKPTTMRRENELPNRLATERR